MTREDLDFIGSMNMCDKISNEAYKKIVCHCEEQNSILDKIREEIKQTTSRYTISRERGARGQIEWSDRLIKENEVLAILDKYKVESEGE